MSQRIDAIYENGAFHPAEPLQMANGERVSLSIEPRTSPDDLSDVADLLDVDYIESCRRKVAHAPSLEEVRKALSVIPGSVSDLISAERDER